MPGAGSGNRWSRVVEFVRESAIVSRLRTITWTGAHAVLVRALGSFADWTDRLRKFVTSVAVVAGIAVGIWIIIDLSVGEPLVFDDLHVHGPLAKQLPEGKYLARRVSTHFDQFTASIERLRQDDDAALKPDTDLPNLEIPGADVSVQAVVQIVRRFLGHRERRITGDVFLSPISLAAPADDGGASDGVSCPDGQAVYIVVRLSAARGELVEPVEARICVPKAADSRPELAALHANFVEGLLQLAALRAYERINPCGSAAYYFRNWYRRSLDGRVLDSDFRRASRMVSACMAVSGHQEAAYAHHILGRIRQASGRPLEAPRFFESAERLHLRSHSWLRRQLHKAGIWHVRFPDDFYAHWGSVLMDTGNTAEALRKFDLQIRHGARSTLGYIGKGNALRVLADGDGEKLAAAIETYCEGARRHRFDPEVRHVLADVLEKHPSLKGCRKRPVDRLAYILELRHKAVDLDPTNRTYLLALGRSLRNAGQGAAAVAVFNSVLHITQDEDWEAFTELAKTYENLGKTEDKVATYRRANDARRRQAEQRPLDEQVRYQGALAALAVDKVEEARKRARAAVARDPSRMEYHLALACAEWRAGDVTAAAEAAAAARRLNGNSDDFGNLDVVLAACMAEIKRAMAKAPR